MIMDIKDVKKRQEGREQRGRLCGSNSMDTFE
jgi:hypothetical protein